MKCDDIYELISLYIDKQLDKEAEEQLFNHIENCSECKKLFDDLTSIVENLEKIPLAELPEDYHNELMSKLNKCSLPENSGKSKVKTKISWKKYVSIAASFIVIVVAAGALGSSISNNNNNFLNMSIPRETAEAPVEDLSTASQYNAGNAVAESAEVQEVSRANLQEPMANLAKSSLETQQDDSSQIEISERKKIKTLNIYLEIKDFDETVEKVKEQTEASGGYVEYFSSSVYNSSKDFKQGNIKLRVPKENYDSLKEFIYVQGEVKNQTENTEDVTGEYIDTQSKLKMKKIEEERLLSLLGNTNNVEEIIKIEERLSDVRSYIESYTTSINNWDKLVSFSTINLNMVQVDDEKLSSVNPDFLSTIKNTFILSINNTVDFFENVVVTVILNFIPAVIIIIIITAIFFITKK